MEHFGEHLTIDGYGGDEILLNDRERLLSILNELPSLLSMTKLSEPVVYHTLGNGAKDLGGWSGIVVIEESHISVHTFPQRGFVSADVYTCMNGMNNDFIIDYFRKKYKLTDTESNFIKRGTRYYEKKI